MIRYEELQEYVFMEYFVNGRMLTFLGPMPLMASSTSWVN
jgi:hypothetical protein